MKGVGGEMGAMTLGNMAQMAVTKKRMAELEEQNDLIVEQNEQLKESAKNSVKIAEDSEALQKAVEKLGE